MLAAPPAAAQRESPPIPPLSRDGVPTLAPLVERVMPSVVSVAVVQNAPQEQNPLLRDPTFRRFFDPHDRSRRPVLAAGSGVIVDAEKGYVLTNAHVVANAQRIRVTLADRRSFDATLVGADRISDIAVLRITSDRLTALPLGDSDSARVGDYVVAIGNPFGIGQTVTAGIVSGLSRSGLGNGQLENFIQTDAPINPGNSGGALIDLHGRLIGINSAIIGPSGGNVGIGFAVPTNIARAVMQQIVATGRVRYARLGVAVTDAPADGSGKEGVKVERVEPRSGAERAGLRGGDIIVAVDGRPVRSSAELRGRVALLPVDSDVKVEVLRDGKPMTIEVRLGGG
ncbi:MAG: trypsin-like peptidase domain-containing protein [Alphaproteobacteria bacterium]|nr:trypsin-like peptidase domain-containing protein [Alphaproteobacteria bacterium]